MAKSVLPTGIRHGFVAVFMAVAGASTFPGLANAQTLSANSAALTDDYAALKAENARLRTLIPSQSHAMMDVGYHFTNLWFAGQEDNWPLAQFYLNEVRTTSSGPYGWCRNAGRKPVRST